MTNELIDPEIAAMNAIAAALTPLDLDAIRRVLRWSIERFNARVAASETTVALTGVQATATAGTATGASGPRTFLNFAELLDAAQPESGLDRVLTVAYYFQVVSGQDDWDSQAVNTILKHLGHPSSNITRDLDTLMARTPKAVLQVRKEGTSRQARKRYKLTREGIRVVEKLISVVETPTV